MGIWNTGNELTAADSAFELVAVKGISPVHDVLEIVEFSPCSMDDCPGRFFRIHFIKSRIDAFLFRALEI